MKQREGGGGKREGGREGGRGEKKWKEREGGREVEEGIWSQMYRNNKSKMVIRPHLDLSIHLEVGILHFLQLFPQTHNGVLFLVNTLLQPLHRRLAYMTSLP